MTGPRVRVTSVEARPVLICQACRYAWEPEACDWTAEHIEALTSGCPECGGWLYLGEIAPPDPTPTPRSART